MTTDAAFWDGIAPKYAKQPVSDVLAYDATLDHTRRYLPPQGSIVELGCGTGSTALKLADAASRIVGTDVSAKMVEIARGKSADAPHLSYEALPADAEVPGGPFDTVLAFNLLHLVPDPDAVARAAFAATRPGGHFISKTTCMAEGFNPWKLVIPVMRALGKAPYVRYFSVVELEEIIVRAGFEIVDTAYYTKKGWRRFIVARKPV